MVGRESVFSEINLVYNQNFGALNRQHITTSEYGMELETTLKR